MRRILVLLLLLPFPVIAAEPDAVVLEAKTLTLEERSALPWMRIAVGAGRPLAVKGLSRPARFTEGDDGLVLGRQELGDGDTFEVWRDDDSTRNYALRKGDT